MGASTLTSNVGRVVLVVDLLINDPVDNSILDAITLGDGQLFAEYCFVLLGLGWHLILCDFTLIMIKLKSRFFINY